MKLVFFGTSEFALPILEKIISAKGGSAFGGKSGKFDIIVVTAPDRSVGRGEEMTPSSLKIFVQKRQIPFIQEKKLLKNEIFLKKIKDISPDLMIVAAYGKIIPQEIIEIPKFGVLNIHPSLLPKYRGPSPIQFSILNGEKKTGVSFMLIDKEIDHGPILAQFEEKIISTDTAESLGKKLSELAAQNIIQIIENYLGGKIKPKGQNHSEATFTKILKKDDGLINWSDPADLIERKTRAYYPWPGTFTFFKKPARRLTRSGGNDKKIRLKILEIRLHRQVEIYKGNEGSAGLVGKSDNGFKIKAGNDWLEILKVQPEGSKIMSAEEFLRGHPVIIGQILN